MPTPTPPTPDSTSLLRPSPPLGGGPGSDLLLPSPDRRLLWLRLLLALGIALRTLRYLLVFPLWEDECFLAVNWIDRSWLDLTRELDLHQVAPVVFLWVQKACVDIFGFTELALRLPSFLLSLASLALFTHLSGRLLHGPGRLLAVGAFAVAYPCIRYTAEAKPYGFDLFVNLALVSITAAWWRTPWRSRHLWLFATLAPLAVASSYPAIFTAGGLSLVILALLLDDRRRSSTTPGHSTAATRARGLLPWLVANAAIVATFLAHYFLVTKNQTAAELDFMRDYWDDTFPPYSPLPFLRWLVVVHTSELFSWPVGGARGASTATTLLVITGAVTLIRRRTLVPLLLLLAPLALNFAAAALHRFPYGGHMKFSMPYGPMITILAGLGASRALAFWASRRPRGARIALHTGLLALLTIGVATGARDIANPYKTASDMRARAFARWFFPTHERVGEVVCVREDLHLTLTPTTAHALSWEATYRANLHIYSPRHRRGEPFDLDRVSPTHPLWLLFFHADGHDLDRDAYDDLLERMQTRFELVDDMTFEFPRFDKRERRLLSEDRLTIFEFRPRD